MTTENPELEGGRVLLRPFRRSDVAERLALGQTPEIVRCFGGNPEGLPAYGEEQARAWVDSHMEQPFCWAVELRGRLLGAVRLHGLDLRDRRARLAIGLLDASKLGKGLGREVVHLVLSYAFGTLELHRVDLRVLAYNERAIRCYRACGFVEEGRERESARVGDEWHDDIIMGLLAYEYEGPR